MEITRQETNFQLGLLYFFHLLDREGGLLDERGHEFAYNILDEENLSGYIFQEFIREIWGKTDDEIYQDGLKHIRQCTFENRLRLFSRLYQLANVIGHEALKEVRVVFNSTQKDATPVELDEQKTILQEAESLLMGNPHNLVLN